MMMEYYSKMFDDWAEKSARGESFETERDI